MGQPFSVNQATQLDNIFLYAEFRTISGVEQPSRYPKNLVSWAIDIRGQTARCVRARGARLR